MYKRLLKAIKTAINRLKMYLTSFKGKVLKKQAMLTGYGLLISKHIASKQVQGLLFKEAQFATNVLIYEDETY